MCRWHHLVSYLLPQHNVFSDDSVSVMKFVGYDYKKERTATVDLEADLDDVDIEQD